MKNYFKMDCQDQNVEENSRFFYQKKYDEADDIFEKRFELENGKDRVEELKEVIKDVEKRMDREPVPDSKLISLALGNAYLRLSQCQSEKFQKSKDYYKKALTYLERHIDYTKLDEVDLLIMLNKGKYFRNTAEVGRKSDYERAFSIFKDVTDRIGQVKMTPEKKFHLMLDAKINMGRVKRYSYEFDCAKETFLSLILSLEDYIEEKEKVKLHKIADLDRLLDDAKPDQEIEQYKSSIQREDVLEYSLEYLLQSLIHIGIIYRKERKYERAIEIFRLIVDIDKDGAEENIDANNNLGVCYRKLSEMKNLEVEERNKNFEKAKKKSEGLDKKGNKFATINLYKCKLDGTEKECEELIKDLKENRSDLNNSVHIRFILGRAYAKVKRYDEAIEQFESVYKEKNHIARGSLGFKVSYNLAQCKICNNKFHEARKMLSKLRESLKKNHGYTDILTEIDYGWCLMKEGNYSKALHIYEGLLEVSRDRLDQKQWAQVNNNIADCHIHLGNYERAENFINQIPGLEKNDQWTQYLRGIILLNTAAEKGEEAYGRSYEIFDDLLSKGFAEGSIKSAWIISTILLYNQNNDEGIANNIVKSLNYSLDPVSMKCLMHLSDFILKKLSEGGKEDYGTLYRDFCHIRLTDRGENQSFRRLMDSMDFHFFKPKDRAFLLANIVQIYKYVLDIKDSCLVVYDEQGAVDLPYHYTKLSTLNNLLVKQKDKEPRLRLWNTIYMNDAYEGRVFDELLGRSNSLYQSAIMEKYGNNLIASSVSIDSNVYITSFSAVEDSFQMWSIYGENEKGAAIKFEEDFFDIKAPCKDLVLDNGTNDEYALYKVQYLDVNDDECDEKLRKNLDKIGEYLKKVETRLAELKQEKGTDHLFESAETEVRAFITDRLNEVRFLFKTRSYEYEREWRLIRCSHQSNADDKNFMPPRLYIDVEKDIEDLEVKIGSKLESQKIKDLFVWLRSTKKVKNIELSNLNRVN